MATYQKTIIIESNNRSAQEEFGDTQNDGLYQPKERNKENNRWMTHIPNGLPLEIGDTINLESSMINAVGGGDSVIEFTGFTGQQIGIDKIKDNKAKMKLNFYVTNTGQFNFNLPKQRHQVSYDLKRGRFGSYCNHAKPLGAASSNVPNAVDNNDAFYEWEKSYPYQMPEGCLVKLKVDNNTSLGYVYETHDVPETNVNYNIYLPSITTGSHRINRPNEKRFYIGGKNFTGPHYIAEQNIPIPGTNPVITYNYSLQTPWDYLESELEFDIPPGFITPSALAAKITEQFHKREGNADNFQVSEEKAYTFDIGNVAGGNPGNVLPTRRTVVSDPANVIIPSSVGKPWYNNFNFTVLGKTLQPIDSDTPEVVATNNYNWSAGKFQYSGGAQNFTNIGRGYLENQGDATYYQYMMTARPHYYKACTRLLIEMEKKPMSDTGAQQPINAYTLFTGQRTFPGTGADITTTRHFFPPATNNSPGGELFIAGCMGNGIVIQDALPFLQERFNICQNNIVFDLDPPSPLYGGVVTRERNTRRWNPAPGDAIPTNIIVNAGTKQILEDVFRDYFMVYNKNAETLNPDDPAYRNALAIELNIGRLDDMQTEQKDDNNTDREVNIKAFDGKEVNIPCPYWTAFKAQLEGSVANPYTQSGFQFANKVTPQVTITNNRPGAPSFDFADYNTTDNPSLPGTPVCFEGRFYADYYLDPTYTAEKAYNGEIQFPVGVTRFQVEPNVDLKQQYTLERYTEEIWDNIPTDRAGRKLAFLPVCWRTSAGNEGADYWFGRSGYFNFYFAPIYKARIPPDFQLDLTDAEFNTEFPQPLPLPGEFIGLSPSEITCDLAQLTNVQKKAQSDGVYPPQPLANDLPSGTGAIDVTPKTYIPYVIVGATDPRMGFDDGQGKFSISQFHTPLKAGNGTFQIPKIPQSTEPSVIQAAINFKRAMTCAQYKKGLFKANSINVEIIKFNDRSASSGQIINAQAGIGISKLLLEKDTGEEFEIDSYNNAYLYKDTLFSKMGFSLEQLIPIFGTAQAQFNRANYNEYLGFGDGVDVYKKYNNMVRPFTTNAFISSTMMLAFARLFGFTDIPERTGDPPVPPDPYNSDFFSPVPAENLGGIPVNIEANVQAESDSLIAENLPKKLSYPYLVVRTNLILNPDYIGGKSGYEKLPAIAFVTRNYSEGDYFYSFTTNWSYTIDMPYVISNIITDIRLPNGEPAPIDDNSSVIYKINKLRTLPNIPGIEKDEEILEKQEAKVAPQS